MVCHSTFSYLSRSGSLIDQQKKLNPQIDLDGFIAQLVEHRTGNAKVMGLIPVEA